MGKTFLLTLFFLFPTLHAIYCMAEVTNTEPVSIYDDTYWVEEKYTPTTAEFSRSPKTADDYASDEWNLLSDEQKGEYILKVAKSVVSLRKSFIDPNIIPCLSYKESTFRPQIRAYASNSTAAGLTQVTKTTIKDLFKRGNFESAIDEFSHIRDGESYKLTMQRSLIAQVEAAIGVLEQKSKDLGTKKSYSILQAYRGSTKSVNQKYAAAILKCKECIINNGGKFYESCIKKKGSQQ